MKLENRTNKAIIFEMMPKICELRSLGYRMPSIYKAFRGEGLITCSLDHFRANYYAFKREMDRSQPAAPVAELVPTTVVQTAPKVLSETAARVPTTVESTDKLIESSHECEKVRYETGKSEKNKPEQKKTESAFIGEPDLEMQDRIARIAFAENRNKQKRRRRHAALKPEVNGSQSAESTKAAVSKSAIKPVTESPGVVKPTAAEFVGNTNPKKNKSENNEPKQKKTESTPIGAPDLDMQISIARMAFAENKSNQNRGRNKRR